MPRVTGTIEQRKDGKRVETTKTFEKWEFRERAESLLGKVLTAETISKVLPPGDAEYLIGELQGAGNLYAEWEGRRVSEEGSKERVGGLLGLANYGADLVGRALATAGEGVGGKLANRTAATAFLLQMHQKEPQLFIEFQTALSRGPKGVNDFLDALIAERGSNIPGVVVRE